MKQLLLILSIATVVNSCAQTRLPVVKSYGFFRQNSRGTMRVDEKNNPVISAIDSQYEVYIETAATIHPVFTKAWISNQTYNVSGFKSESRVTVGSQINNENSIEITAKPGNTLWKLELQKTSLEPLPVSYAPGFSSNNALVSGTINKKPFNILVNNLTELKPVNYP